MHYAVEIREHRTTAVRSSSYVFKVMFFAAMRLVQPML